MGATLGSYIRERRLQLDLSQAELAGLVGCGYQQSDISRLERGHIDLPRLGTLIQIASALEVPVGNLLIASGWFTEQDTLATILGEIETELDTMLDLEGETQSRSDRLQAMIRELHVTSGVETTMIDSEHHG